MSRYIATHTYLADNGRTVLVSIRYDDPTAAGITAQQRLSLGGFSTDTEAKSCKGIIIPRKKFKPRHVLYKYGFKDGRDILEQVTVRSHEAYMELVNKDPNVRIACGECGCPIPLELVLL